MIAGALLRNEVLKARKSLGFWAPALAGLGIQALINGTRYYEALKNPEESFALPEAWGVILTQGVEAGFVFGTVALVLLVSNEFTWRTARQSVIDGLSKDQFFLAKVFLLLFLVVVFGIGQIVVAAGFAVAGTDFAAQTGPLIGLMHLRLIAGNCLALLGYGSMAFFVALAVRSGGAAMGVWFFYWMMGEQILRGILATISDGLGEAARFLPAHAFEQLTRYFQYDAAAFQDAIAAAMAAGRAPPAEPWAWPVLLACTMAWTGSFLIGAFLWFRRRDL